MEKLDHRICEIHKKYDEFQMEARSKEAKLKALRDQLEDLKKDGETVKANVQDSPQAKVLESLIFLRYYEKLILFRKSGCLKIVLTKP